MKTRKTTRNKVNYRKAEGNRRCGNCAMFTRTGLVTGDCDILVGKVSQSAVCDRWVKDGTNQG
jgi:hypothetical protein